ncbi:copper resistance protein CopD [Helicobacter mesocricetorum]|uniref:copper resistance protein CopD n=1 Tax=Helicobacter mesocricetorum TaxID=87012 RepID=UPI000CF059BA|nr:copper resistance protein CopD [Helicobacter mesocricetorum]
MEVFYPYFLIVHLMSAIIFLGFIFTDVVLLAPLREVLGEEFADKMFQGISKRGSKIMPFCLLLLVLSGGAMIGQYVGSGQGYFDTFLQKALWFKVFFASLIVLAVIISLTCHYILKVRNPLGKIIHPLALVFGVFIVVLAKIAFYFS